MLKKLLTAELPACMEVYYRDPIYIKGNPRPRQAQSNIGPCWIVRRVPNGPYIIRDATCSERRIPIDQLVFSRTDGATVADADTYEVKEIIDDKYNKVTRRWEYLIWWKHYPRSESTWEPIEHINDTKTITKYNAKKKLAKVRSIITTSASIPTELNLSRWSDLPTDEPLSSVPSFNRPFRKTGRRRGPVFLTGKKHNL